MNKTQHQFLIYILFSIPKITIYKDILAIWLLSVQFEPHIIKLLLEFTHMLCNFTLASQKVMCKFHHLCFKNQIDEIPVLFFFFYCDSFRNACRAFIIIKQCDKR